MLCPLLISTHLNLSLQVLVKHNGTRRLQAQAPGGPPSPSSCSVTDGQPASLAGWLLAAAHPACMCMLVAPAALPAAHLHPLIPQELWMIAIDTS